MVSHGDVGMHQSAGLGGMLAEPIQIRVVILIGEEAGLTVVAARAGSRSAPAAKARDIYRFFDNDVKVRAPFDAQGLMTRLGLQWKPAVSEVEDGASPA